MGIVTPVISAGAGAFLWNDDNPFESGVGRLWELGMSLRLPGLGSSSFELGAKVASLSQSVVGGMILSDSRGTYWGFVGGLVVPLLRL
jgi:hypothetical protein